MWACVLLDMGLVFSSVFISLKGILHFCFSFVIFYLILLKCLNYWQGRGGEGWWNVKFLAQVILSMKTSAFTAPFSGLLHLWAPEHLVSLSVTLGFSLPLSFLELLHSSLVFPISKRRILPFPHPPKFLVYGRPSKITWEEKIWERRMEEERRNRIKLWSQCKKYIKPVRLRTKSIGNGNNYLVIR